MSRARGSWGRFLQAGVLFAWLVAFWWLLGWRRYQAFLRPEFGILLLMGMVVLLGYLWAFVCRPTTACGRPEGGVALLVRCLTLALPLLYLFFAQGEMLDSYAFERRVTNMFPAKGKGDRATANTVSENTAATDGEGTQRPDADDDGLGEDEPTAGDETALAAMANGDKATANLDAPTVAATQTVAAPPAVATAPAVSGAAPVDKETDMDDLLEFFDKHNGQRVATLGMVYHHERVPENCFLLFRFLIICCAADASPVYMLIQSDEAAAQESDKWVRVEGTLGAMEIEGEKMAFIAADRVTPVKEPDSPYLY